MSETVKVPLRARDGSVKAYAIIDAADAPVVNRWRWCLDADGYARRNTTRRQGGKLIQVEIKLHRQLLGLTPGDGLEGDHIDRDKLNCQRSNLRAVPRAGNGQNLPSVRGSSSTFRGVSWSSDRGKWLACARIGGKTVNLGRYDSETEAAEVARAARLREMPYAVD